MKEVGVNELKGLMDRGETPVVIDVRTPVEFRSARIAAATNLPLDEIDEETLARLETNDKPLYLICQSGARSHKALQKLEALGKGANSVSVAGGMRAWEENGFPVVEGKKVMSLERQVRIAAGSLVFLGALLSVMVHPGFVWLSAFVGAGLVFAGVTDTCGMGLLLARMPWNR